MTIKVTTKFAPAEWASYLVNGDNSGLEFHSPGETAQADAWLADIAPARVVSTQGETTLQTWRGMLTELVKYVLHIDCQSDAAEYAGATLSEGTLRTSDLLQAFVPVLAAIAPESKALNDAQAMLELFSKSTHICQYAIEGAADVLEWVTDELNENAPDGYCFGAHPDDGACFGFWETEDSANEREWSEFTAELDEAHDGTSFTRKVNLANDCTEETQQFTVFAFDAYGSTYVAVPAEGALEARLEAAAETLRDIAPGLFTDLDIQAARDEMLSAGDLTEAEYLDFDSDEVSDKVHEHATTDLTHTEFGYIASWEWTIVSMRMTRVDLLAFARKK